MKAKIVLPVIILLIISVFVGNWIYGNISTKKLDSYLSNYPNHSQLKYEDIKVNPLWSKITFKNFSFIEPNTGYKIESEVLYVSMKHTEALDISKTRRIDRLTKLGLNFKNVKILDKDKIVFAGESAQLDFKGDMSQEKFKNMFIKFPDEKQQVGFTVKNGEFNYLSMQNSKYGSSLAGLTEIKSADIKISLDPEEKELNIESLNIKAGELSLEGELAANYRGQGFRDFSASKINMEYDCALSNQVSWGDSNSTGKYSLDSFSSMFKGEVELDDNGVLLTMPSNALFKLKMKGLTAQYEGQAKSQVETSLSMLGLHAEDLSVNEFSFSTEINSDEWIIEDTKLKMPILEAALKASLKTNKVNPNDPGIEKMQIRISNINQKLNDAIGNLSATFGFKIPRDGDDIVLEMQGSISNPKIKGVHY